MQVPVRSLLTRYSIFYIITTAVQAARIEIIFKICLSFELPKKILKMFCGHAALFELRNVCTYFLMK